MVTSPKAMAKWTKHGQLCAAIFLISSRLRQSPQLLACFVRLHNEIVIAKAGSEARQDANKATASGEVREALDETGDAIDDSWITTKVKSQLLADDDVKGMDIDVDTKANIVHLIGVVPTAQARNEAISIAKETKGVLSVNASRLVIRAEVSKR